MKKDGTIIDLYEDKNIWVSSFRISSPSPEHMTDSIEGRNGSIYFGTTIKERKITSSLMIEANNEQEFDLLRDEIFQLFNPLQKFYIIRDLQPGKRMEVSVLNEYNLNYLSLEDGEFDIEFIIHSAFVESVGSTLTAVNIDTLWQVSGMEAKDLIYKQTSPTFKIYNDGNVLIDPRIVPLIITFKGASNNLSIKNITTGDEWTFSGTSNPDDSIILDGIRSTKNGLSIYRETNHKLITLIPGMNEFELTGATDPFEISFDFYFYYL
jgi:phage-related protein